LTGDSPILSLNLWYDQGKSNWTSLTGLDSYSLSEYFKVDKLTPGQDYKFKYRAINIFGIGAFSEEYSVKAATKPD
jgi:hypothetical protein